ncbi:PRTRC system protein A [Polaromonas sp. AET17H-212]|uniref:PRTRC system protein A n=1 Tax=Polaromonas sp. AET17H-212 TaxID=1977061 RepID=UPI000BBC4828|nr:PRTRC system protein A [Polaromonas sp. AET17H-212]
METMDQVVQAAFPVVSAPRFSSLEAGAKPGSRHIVAKDGLWREITLPWIRSIHPIAACDVPLPYGALHAEIELFCGPIPKDLRQKFVRDATAASPYEMAAAMIWNQATGGWRYAVRENLSAGHAFVTYNEVSLEEGEFLVLDLHSHGEFDAYFSERDDADDAGSMKFSGVIGNLNTGTPTTVMRLNLLGKTWAATMAADGTLEVLE